MPVYATLQCNREFVPLLGGTLLAMQHRLQQQQQQQQEHQVTSHCKANEVNMYVSTPAASLNLAALESTPGWPPNFGVSAALSAAKNVPYACI
jgi:hypothetical protein